MNVYFWSRPFNLPFKILHLICPGGNGLATPLILVILLGISAGRDFEPHSDPESKVTGTKLVQGHRFFFKYSPSSLLISLRLSSLAIPVRDSLARLLNKKSNWLSVFEGVGLVAA